MAAILRLVLKQKEEASILWHAPVVRKSLVQLLPIQHVQVVDIDFPERNQDGPMPCQ